MRTSCRGRSSGRALSIRAARLFHARSGFHARKANLESHGYAKRYVGEGGETDLTSPAGGALSYNANMAERTSSRCRASASLAGLEQRQRAVNTREDFLFSENFQ